MQNVYDDNRPAWKRFIEFNLLCDAAAYSIPVEVLYDFTRFLGYYLPDNLDYQKLSWHNAAYEHGCGIEITLSFPNSSEAVRFRMISNNTVSITVLSPDKESFIISVSIRNYYSEVLREICSRFKCRKENSFETPPDA